MGNPKIAGNAILQLLVRPLHNPSPVTCIICENGRLYFGHRLNRKIIFCKDCHTPYGPIKIPCENCEEIYKVKIVNTDVIICCDKCKTEFSLLSSKPKS